MAVMRANRVGGNWLMKWDEVKKNPDYTFKDWRTGREWPLNCMTVILAFMTIKHSISKIEWALNDYIIQLSSTSQSSCQESSRQLETRCVRESHTRPRGPSGTPMEWTPASGEQERHNVMVNSGVKMLQFMFELQLPLTCNPWTTLSNPWNKVRGKYFVKEVFLRLLSLRLSLSLRLCYCVVVMQ